MKLEVLKFSSPTCGPCKLLSKVLENVTGITEVSANTDGMKLFVKYNVRKVPTLIFLKDGVEVHKEVGAISLTKYNDIINDIKFSKEL
jgi:thioredoxin 1